MPDTSFKDFVLDQLAALPDLRARAMFGGHGLYQDDRFFGILFAGRLYFKTDEQSRADYEHRGMGPFTFEKEGETIAMRYFEVPPDVLENRDELQQWASRAIEAASSMKAKSKPRAPTAKPASSLPQELAVALTESASARAAFEKLSSSCRREYVEWIAGAKKAETRVRRVRQALTMLAKGQRPG